MPPAPARFPRHLVIDGFLQPALHARLLEHALCSEAHFHPTEIRVEGGGHYNPDTRRSWACMGGLGPAHDDFLAVVESRRDALLAELGIPPFSPARSELELAAHRDGGFFGPHIDTFTGQLRTGLHSDRVLTMVYYFHRQPKGFSGGALALHPFSKVSPLLIEPVDNRLVAFPSFAMHSVQPIQVPGDAWDNARFAVNCWFHRARAA